VDHDSRQTGIAANAGLAAVTRNGLSEVMRVEDSGLLRRYTDLLIPDVSKECTAFNFKSEISRFL